MAALSAHAPTRPMEPFKPPVLIRRVYLGMAL